MSTADDLFCRDCGWYGSEEDLPITKEKYEFWGAPVTQDFIEMVCPVCGHDALEEKEDQDEALI